MKKRPKVLMLGWEFPPFVEGGLAAATYGLVKELRHLADITLILPRNEPEGHLEGVKIIGLNHLEKDVYNTLSQSVSIEDISETFTMIYGPYPFADSRTAVFVNNYRFCLEKVNEVFATKEVYGPLINEQRYFYSCAAVAIAQTFQFDIIHAHDWVTFEAAVKIKTITGKPLAIHVHSLETDRVGDDARNEVYEVERQALQQADIVFAVSAYTKTKIHENYMVSGNKVLAVHNGIEKKDIDPYAHPLRQKIVVFAGRITQQKGPYALLETARKVVNLFDNVLFVVAGKGDQLQYLMMQGADLNLFRHFIFTGFLNRQEIERLYSAADVYFMPSVSEPFGLTALEALQAGTPVVISRQSGVAEVLPDADIADFWDTDLFAELILKHLNDDRQRYSELPVFNDLSWSAAATKVLNTYKTIL